MIERRFIKGTSATVRAIAGQKPGIEGYASVFNEEYDSGWFIETIKPGAFTRALKEKQDVRCLFNHDANNLLGRTKANTVNLTQDTQGLKFSCDLPDTNIGKDVMASITRGDLDGCSFSFQVTKQTWREEKEDPNDPRSRMVQYRDIEDVDLYDVGPVTYPAYEGTSVGARALWPQGVPAEVRTHVPALNSKDLRIAPSPDDPPDDGDNDPDNEMEDCSCRCRACFGGDHEECDDYMESCSDPENCEAMASMRSSHQKSEQRDGAKTKRVDGEDLTSSAFAYVGDETQTSTWKFPIKFSTEEKTKAHIRNALARFSSADLPEGEKAKVLAKIKAAAAKHGIHVSDESKSADNEALELAKARTRMAEISLS